MVGRDAFRTATGVHAAAVIKAFNKGDEWLADMVYSGVPARMLNREQTIEIGPMSGKSNVIFWLQRNGFEPTNERVERIFNRAKQSDAVLTNEDLLGNDLTENLDAKLRSRHRRKLSDCKPRTLPPDRAGFWVHKPNAR